MAEQVVAEVLAAPASEAAERAGARAADGRSVEALARIVMEDPRLRAAPVGRNMVRGILEDAMRARRGGAMFGDHLLFDELPLAVCSPAGRAYRAVMLLDEGSRLALGVAVEEGQADLGTVKAAALDAVRRLETCTLPGIAAAEGEPRVTVALAEANAVEVLRFFRRMPGWDWDTKPRGRPTLAVLGRSIGRVSIRPGLNHDRGLRECDDDVPMVSREEAMALLDLALVRHNSSVSGPGEEAAGVRGRRLSLARVLRLAAETI